MEGLLNKLIEKGWEPRWIYWEDIEVCSYDKKGIISIWYMDWETPSKWEYEWEFKNLRELVSEESWLWQFICKNKLVSIKWYSYNEVYDDSNYGYRLIESALCSKEELEKFLLDNIKVS